MSEPVDVVIPAWTETLDHLDDTLGSLRDWMRPIVVFNGPGSGELLVEHFEDDRVQWTVPLSGAGCFLCRARNWGLGLASTDYVMFMDADDLFLEGVDDVYAAAQGHRGAWGGMLVASDTREREVAERAAPPDGLPHAGTFVLRRDGLPKFNLKAPHQVRNRGPLYNARWWQQIGSDDLVHVDATAIVYRWNWSPMQATKRYQENEGFIGDA